MLKKFIGWFRTKYAQDKDWEKYLMVLLVVSIIPLIWIGKYNVMSADDYAIGKEAHQVWVQNHSFSSMLDYAVSHTAMFYNSWRGCFTINFLESWNPGYFGERLTWFTPVIMLTMILTSLYLLIKALLKQFHLYDRKEALVLWACISFLVIQTMPSPVEGLYWYAGAIAYSFLHYFMFIFFSFILFWDKKRGRTADILLMLCAVLMAFILGGCQYSTVLISIIVYVFYLIMQYRKFRPGKLLPGLALLAGFLISFMAPGNSVRQGNENGLSPFSAILRSFLDALVYGKRWISPLFLIVLLFLFPVIWKLLKKVSSYQFKYCHIVVLFSFCVFAASFTPPLYGVGNVESGRILNQIQVLYYILVFIDYFYCVGWLKTKIDHSERGFFHDLGCILHIISQYVVRYKWLMLIILALVWIGTGDKNTFSGLSAARSLAIGEAQGYYAESENRLQKYLDENVKVVEVMPYSVRPKVLFFNDIKPEGDADYWINTNIADYYNKDKVVMKQ